MLRGTALFGPHSSGTMQNEHTPHTITHDNAPLTERDAARIDGLSVSWHRTARMRGIGPPYIRIGRTIRYRRADLERWLASHRVQTTE
jgi:predicted DNA-binding transcriptional regulator AlpA